MSFQSECFDRLKYGLPLGTNQLRKLYQVAFNEIIPVLKACKKCAANGCPECGQTGYIDQNTLSTKD